MSLNSSIKLPTSSQNLAVALLERLLVYRTVLRAAHLVRGFPTDLLADCRLSRMEPEQSSLDHALHRLVGFLLHVHRPVLLGCTLAQDAAGALERAATACHCLAARVRDKPLLPAISRAARHDAGLAVHHRGRRQRRDARKIRQSATAVTGSISEITSA